MIFDFQLRPVGDHLSFMVGATEIDFTFLGIGFVHHFLILIPDEIGFSGSEVGCGAVHFFQDILQRSIGTLLRPRRREQ